MQALVCSLAVLLILFFANINVAVADQEQGSDSVDTSSETYPHITLLESTILGQCFAGQSLIERIGRLEKKAFGSESHNPSLSDRTDALDQYVEQHLHKKLVRTDAEADAADAGDDDQPGQDQTAQTSSDYPRVTALENAILGQSFAGQPLIDRLSRMEITAFGKPADNPDLSARTDALEKYAEKTLHKKPMNSATDETATANPQQSSGKKELFSKVGRTLLGMTGLGMMPGMGFGPSNLPPNQTVQKPEPQPEVHKDDPALLASNPPAPSAKLLTKVGWCEMQVYGQTFPNMHLPERLGQLNQKLNFEPGKSNLELMDDIGNMIKIVQSQKPANKSISSKVPSPAIN